MLILFGNIWFSICRYEFYINFVINSIDFLHTIGQSRKSFSCNDNIIIIGCLYFCRKLLRWNKVVSFIYKYNAIADCLKLCLPVTSFQNSAFFLRISNSYLIFLFWMITLCFPFIIITYTYNPAIGTNSFIEWTVWSVFNIFMPNSPEPKSIRCRRFTVISCFSANFKIHFAQLFPQVEILKILSGSFAIRISIFTPPQ